MSGLILGLFSGKLRVERGGQLRVSFTSHTGPLLRFTMSISITTHSLTCTFDTQQ